MKRVFFFFLILPSEEGKIYSLMISPQVALQQLILSMASRFEIVDKEYIEELKDKSENENTTNSTRWQKNVFKIGRMKETYQQI